MPMKMKRKEACELVAKSLRDYGYSDATGDMVDEILTSWLEGKRFPDLPHGVIGAFAAEQFKDVSERGADLSRLA